MTDPFVLILYYSRHGSTEQMARFIAEGVLQIAGIKARIRTVAPLSTDQGENLEPEHGPAYASKDDLRECSALILGSPTRFGNMAAPLKHFIDSTSDIWLSGGLIDKPAAAFTSSSTMHGGQESTLLSMILPLLHHGAVIVGIPYSEAALNHTTSGGTPYGPSHVAGLQNNQAITQHEQQLCKSLGKRVASLAKTLSKKKGQV